MTLKKIALVPVLMSASLLAMTASTLAADVPAGIALAKQQHLVKDNGAEPATLDPHKTEGVPGANVQRDLFEGLVTSGPNGETLPGVAERWETNDNKRFVFHLRANAKWSNGEPVTARDFEYSFKRAIAPDTASPYAWYLEIPTIVNASAILKGEKEPTTLGIKALDEHTLEIQLEQPVPYFVTMLSHTTTYPIYRPAVEQHGDNWTRPGNLVSNGAYTLSSWRVNEKIELVRNTHYWDNEHTVIDQVDYLPITSQNAAMNRFLAGELDLTNEIPIEHFKRLNKDHPESVSITGYVGTYYYTFNTQKPPFDDVRVRKALSYAIDRDIIARLVMGQGELPGYTLTPEIVDGFTPPRLDWANWTQAERNARALALLDEAGFNKQNPLKFELLYNTSENHKKVAVAVASMWKKTLGAEAELVNQEWKTYLDTKTQGNFDVARAGWIADYNEASSMLDLQQTTHGNNDGKYSSLQYDELMKATRSIVDADARNAKYTQAEEILAADMPIAPIYQYVTARLVQQRLGGYPNNPLNNLYSKDMYIKAE
ncbi:peptide ABC transporter substrate-binding protein [Oceanisphaera marina]|uniref:Peptide ABC transporter substrate-binding protein n=1 Tax=Oceanisphaera marina TaxID=2017550 RepID=A0ABQ1IEF3_9GAMM|nr:ABC transporter substrate-binding protein [Oceanisphaera marina]GGB34533.1 peptide ABC transporter substrate-binding protein [Oceanisphaera marina]